MVEGGTVPRAVHLPGRICIGCTSWKGHSCCLPLCLSRLRFSYTLFTAKLDERRKRDGMEREGVARPLPPPLHFSSSKLDKCSPLIIFPLSTSFHRNSNLLPGFFHVENWIFSHNGSERDGYYTVPPSASSLSLSALQETLLAAKIPSCGAGRSLESYEFHRIP